MTPRGAVACTRHLPPGPASGTSTRDLHPAPASGTGARHLHPAPAPGAAGFLSPLWCLFCDLTN